MKEVYCKLMFGIIKKMLIVLLASIVNDSNHTKSVSLSYQKYKIQPTLINLHPNEESQKLHYYPFAVKLEKCVGICYNVNYLSNKVCAPNETKVLSIHGFNMITGKCKYNCKFDGKNVIQINGGIMINVDVSVKYVIY